MTITPKHGIANHFNVKLRRAELEDSEQVKITAIKKGDTKTIRLSC